MSAGRGFPNKSESWADNAATRTLALEVFVLRGLVDAMTEVAHQREAEIEWLKELLDERRGAAA